MEPAFRGRNPWNARLLFPAPAGAEEPFSRPRDPPAPPSPCGLQTPPLTYAMTTKNPTHSSAGITLAAFQTLIRDRYFATDSARGTPGTFMWLIEEVGELATSLQENAPGKNPTPEQRHNLEEEFADVLAWLTTLANIHGIDMEKAVSKYTDKGRVEGVKD